MPYRNKTYVAFDGHTDMRYYALMLAWKQSDNLPFNFYNAHDLNTARDDSLEASIKAQLAVRMNNSKVFVLLVGERTMYLYKFVRWEIEQALSRNLPVIAVNLNGTRCIDSLRCPPILRERLAMHVSFNAAIVQYALESWPQQHHNLCTQSASGPYYYPADVYRACGL